MNQKYIYIYIYIYIFFFFIMIDIENSGGDMIGYEEELFFKNSEEKKNKFTSLHTGNINDLTLRYQDKKVFENVNRYIVNRPGVVGAVL